MSFDYSGDGEIIALCPTRDNPEGAREMVASFYDTVERIETSVILVVDEDDPKLAEYQTIPEQFRSRVVVSGHVLRPDTAHVMVVPGGSLTKATNEAVERLWDAEAIIGHVGDDHRFRTQGWDNAIRDVLKDNPGVAYANDGFPTIWASAWWTNTIIIRTLGWLAVPGSMHLSIDDVFMDIGAGLNRLTYLPDVFIEHLHPAGGKVPWRDIVKSHYVPAKRALETANLERYRREDFANDIHKLQDVLGDPRTEVTDLQPGVTWRRAYREAHMPPGRHRWRRKETIIR